MEHAIESGRKHEEAAAPRTRKAAAEAPPTHPVLELQEQVGNQALLELLREGWIHARLSVSHPHDPDELEADEMAAQVMDRPPQHHGAAPCHCSGDGEMCEECRRKQTISRKAAAHASAAPHPEAVERILRAPSQPLDLSSRSFFEPRFNRDFSPVRIHNDPAAAAAARSVQALAFTVGEHLVFAEGQYAPHSSAGARLLAHELAHVVQHGAASGLIRRKTPDKPSGPDYVPENSMRSNIEELDITALPAFQDAVDKVDEKAVTTAGQNVKAIWERVEGNFNDVQAPVSSTSGDVVKPPDVVTDFNKERRKILTSISTQTYKGVLVMGKLTVPDIVGSLVPFIDSQTAQVAWVVKDTAALMTLLRKDKLEDADQWTVVGLLRQHINPWNYRYMVGAAQMAGLASKFSSFARKQAEALQTLTDTVMQMKLIGDVGPADQVGLFEFLPTENKVRLSQPASPSEVAAKLYGSEDRWQTVLLPLNPSALAGKGGQDWLLMGTELHIDPASLAKPYDLVYRTAILAQQQQRQTDLEDYIEAEGDRIAVIGNTVKYTLRKQPWNKSAYPDTAIQWSIDYDPAAVAEGKADKTENGPSGLVSGTDPSKNKNLTFDFQPSVVGTHIIHCRLSASGTTQDLTYPQSVITIDQKVAIEKARGFDYTFGSPQAILAQLKKDLNDTPDTPANKTKRNDLNRRITEIEQSLKDAGKSAHSMGLIPATYISKSDKPLRLPLRLFVGDDPAYNEADTGYNLKLWDYTMLGQPYTLTYQDERIMPALEGLLRLYAKKRVFPTGVIIAQISNMLVYSGVYNETLTLDAPGPTLMDDFIKLLPPEVLRGLSMGFLGLAVASGLLGQEEVAVPAFEVSMYLGGAAAAEELSQKLEHGDFELDLGTAMQIADLVSALIGAGAAFEMAATARGVGRLAVTPALAGIGKGVGYAQIGIIAGSHVTEIAAAVKEGDRKKITSAILHALGDAAFFLIVHKAAGGKGADLEPDTVPHTELRTQGADEAPVGGGHDVVVTKDGKVYRCSETCEDLIWAFEQILHDRPEIRKDLEAIARKPKGNRIPAAKELLARLEGLQDIRNLSNAELADRIAKNRGTKAETDLKLERIRRAGVDISSEDILEYADINTRNKPGGKGVPDPFEIGNFAHGMYERLDGLIGPPPVTSDVLPSGVIKEYTIPQTKLPFEKRPRIDRLDRAGEMIYEIKPKSQLAKGQAQAAGYAELMDKLEPLPGGRKWGHKCITYDEVRVESFLRSVGVL